MSDTEAMVRVMEHAAELLHKSLGELTPYAGDGAEYARVRNRCIAAMATARAVLQMVAASASPERRAVVEEMISYLLEGDDEVGYLQWAEKHSGVSMSDGELADVGRYLRAMVGGEST